jgi:hypothetical protein
MSPTNISNQSEDNSMSEHKSRLRDFERLSLERFVATHEDNRARYLEALAILAEDHALADDDCPTEPQIALCKACGYDIDGLDTAFACICHFDDLAF